VELDVGHGDEGDKIENQVLQLQKKKEKNKNKVDQGKSFK
jgi:hypothetical protein